MQSSFPIETAPFMRATDSYLVADRSGPGPPSHHSSTLKMVAVGSSETLVSTKLYNIMLQRTIIAMLFAVRPSNVNVKL